MKIIEFIKKNLVLLLSILLVIAIGTSYYFFHRFSQLSGDSQKVSQEEVRKLVAAVSKLIVLPTDESPTIATVLDPEKLKSQPFFINAKKGDKVLIYANTKKAILYDPVNNKIVEVAPINIGNPAN